MIVPDGCLVVVEAASTCDFHRKHPKAVLTNCTCKPFIMRGATAAEKFEHRAQGLITKRKRLEKELAEVNREIDSL